MGLEGRRTRLVSDIPRIDEIESADGWIELPKAEYAVGYFTEMGIGCRRDPLEANVWYVRAAGHGDDRAKSRLKIINEAASGGKNTKNGKKSKKTLEKKSPGAAGEGDKGECCVM